MRIAVVADVHGNRLALEAVIAHIESAKVDLIANLGDLVSGPFDPAGAADLQMSIEAQTIAGNHERQVLEGSTIPSDIIARSALSNAHVDWIASLPKTLSLVDGEVFACHGSPAGGDLEYLLEDVRSGSPVLDTEENIRARLQGIGNVRVVLCAHTHIPRVVTVDGVLIVNPGSAGFPAYRDETPVPHVMETGSPLARYAIIEKVASEWTAELRAVPYDFEAAAAQAERHGRPIGAHIVRTGRVPPL